MDNDLMKYFIEQTNIEISIIRAKLEDLTKFKIEMLASARTTSFIVSAVCGFISLCVTTAVSIYVGKMDRANPSDETPALVDKK